MAAPGSGPVPESGANGRPDGIVPPRSEEQPSAETLSERDQTSSDADQTLSDTDQSLSDRDQQAADEDQAASDYAHAHGVRAVSYAHTTAERVETSRGRKAAGLLRDGNADHRDSTSEERDALAARRDAAAQLEDQRAAELDRVDELSDKHTLRVQELRGRAAQARRRAREDRQRAGRDREQAARDRDRAAEDRELARRERQVAGMDELTGARRRGVGLRDLENEIARSRRTGARLVTVFVDVDGLKSVNDGLGHAAGDTLLQEVADGLRRHVRSYDLVVRLGGDEFLCVLPGVTIPETRARLGELERELQAAEVPGSISFGVAELCDEDSWDSLVERADRELLAGRNG